MCLFMASPRECKKGQFHEQASITRVEPHYTSTSSNPWARHRVHMWASIARAPFGIHERTFIARPLRWIHEWPSITQAPHRIHKRATIAWVPLRSREWAPLHESLFNPQRDSSNLPPFHERHSMKPLYEGIAWNLSTKSIPWSHYIKELHKTFPWTAF